MRRSLLMPGMKVIDFENNKANEYLGAILIIIAFLNAFIAWYQGHKADAILASFLSMMLPSCKVVCGGEISSLPAGEGSTLVVSGEGFGIVVRTGDHTFIGQIAGMTRGEPDNKLVQFAHFTRLIINALYPRYSGVHWPRKLTTLLR
ncbi:hypothetical protein PSTG_07028 [Puccinia striiformis f. sp. tritici PST-78]|uniref:Uncharacterized protein n=1 Tax=Puccinia striiformis f. sp. tritici PST-78 TaxID=1165861 RepID=A0A0L0VKD6_9BASI|nr:hypothetical protein PSTG_07028 [Puccinia striiformis f. sp. tritici PST-78]